MRGYRHISHSGAAGVLHVNSYNPVKEARRNGCRERVRALSVQAHATGAVVKDAGLCGTSQTNNHMTPHEAQSEAQVDIHKVNPHCPPPADPGVQVANDLSSESTQLDVASKHHHHGTSGLPHYIATFTQFAKIDQSMPVGSGLQFNACIHA